jgi:hypothetical protein
MNDQRSTLAALGLAGGCALGALMGVVSGVMTKEPAGTGLHLRDRVLGLGRATGVFPAVVVLIAALVVRSVLGHGDWQRAASITVLAVAGLVVVGSALHSWALASQMTTDVNSRPAFQALERAVEAIPAVLAGLLVLPLCGPARPPEPGTDASA